MIVYSVSVIYPDGSNVHSFLHTKNEAVASAKRFWRDLQAQDRTASVRAVRYHASSKSSTLDLLNFASGSGLPFEGLTVWSNS